jgi:multisubunit Na+/H+ antiporter MnhF subunit
MTLVATVCLLVLVGCLPVCLLRVARGPHAMDRLLTFDLTAVLLVLALALLAVVRDAWVYLEIAMGLAVLSLVATVGVAHYIDDRQVF